MKYSPFLQLWMNPEQAANLSTLQFDRILRAAKRQHLAAVLGERLSRLARFKDCPQALQDQLVAAKVMADEHRRRVLWELNRVERTLVEQKFKLVLLKGAAYLLAGLKNAQGRLLSDLDILVAKADLPKVEKALLAAGWQSEKSTEYDDRYYRQWMHELPPLSHPERGVAVDLHHNIFPPTGYLKLEAGKLLEKIVPIEGHKNLYRLCDTDLVLHLSVHLFYDGDLRQGLRELADLDVLLSDFGGKQQHFYRQLVQRADELKLAEPLFYALHFSAKLFETPVPPEILLQVRRALPFWPVHWLQIQLMRQALWPHTQDQDPVLRKGAVFLLYVRSHWLRMPPLLLIRHLLIKWQRRCCRFKQQVTG